MKAASLRAADMLGDIIANVLYDEKRWCKGAVVSYDGFASWLFPNPRCTDWWANRFSVVGALLRSTRDSEAILIAIAALADVLRTESYTPDWRPHRDCGFPHDGRPNMYAMVQDFNDDRDVTFEQIIQLIKLAQRRLTNLERLAQKRAHQALVRKLFPAMFRMLGAVQSLYWQATKRNGPQQGSMP